MWPAQTMSSFMKMTSLGVLQCDIVELDGDGYSAVRMRDDQGKDVGEELVRSTLEGGRTKIEIISTEQTL